MTELVLVRHATSVVPQYGRPDDDERPLAPQGLRQAEELVPMLRAMEPTAVFSSPYRRAV